MVILNTTGISFQHTYYVVMSFTSQNIGNPLFSVLLIGTENYLLWLWLGYNIAIQISDLGCVIHIIAGFNSTQQIMMVLFSRIFSIGRHPFWPNVISLFGKFLEN